MSSYGPFVMTMSRHQKQEFGLDWTNWLDSGETIVSATAAATTESGASASILTGSAAIDGSIVTATKDQNSGTTGSVYFVVFTATTSTGRVLGGDRIGTVKLRIAENF